MINSTRAFDYLRLPDRNIWALGLFAVAALSLPLQAQDEDFEETYVLSPFEVDSSQDVGYRATNSTSGTSLNTAIKDVPMAIQVVTEEFIGDLGATDMEEALAFSAGVFTSELEANTSTNGPDANRSGGSNEKSVSSSAGGRWSNSVSIRGFSVPFQNRLGFRVGGIVVTPDTNIALGGTLDSVNIDRLEVVKGPNSLLYGIGVLSGIVNTIPKKPLSVNSYKASISAGSYGFRRGTFEATGPLIKAGDEGTSLNYRVALAGEERGHYTDFSEKELQYGAFQLDYFYKDKANLFLEYQNSYTKYNGTGSQWIYDDLSNSSLPDFRNEYDEQHNYAREDSVAGIGLVTANIVTVGTNGRPLRTPIVELAFDEADPDARVLTGGSFDDTYRITGGDTYDEREEENFLANLDLFPMENLALSFGVNYTEQETEEFDLNAKIINNRATIQLLNAATAGPYTDADGVERTGNGEIDASMLAAVSNDLVNEEYGFDSGTVNSLDDVKITRYWWSKRPESSESFQWRARATYEFETDFFMDTRATHTLLVGYNRIEDTVRFVNGTESEENVYLADDVTNDALYFRPIWDYSPFVYNGENLAMPGDEYQEQEIWFDGYYGVYHGKLFNEKLGVIAGMRYDKYNATTATFERLSPEQIDAGVTGFEYVENPDNLTYGYSEEPTLNFDEDIDKWSTTIALNYKLTDRLTVYALSSEGLSPNTGLVDGSGDVIDAESTTAKEIGIKFGTLDNRLTGSLAFYKIERENAIWDFDLAPAPQEWYDSGIYPVGYTPSNSAFDPYAIVNSEVVNGETIDTPYSAENFVLNYGIDTAEIDPNLVQAFALRSEVKNEDTNLSSFEFKLPVAYGSTSPSRDENGDEIRFEIPGLVAWSSESSNNQPNTVRRSIWYIDYTKMDEEFELQYYDADNNLQTDTFSWRPFLESAFEKTYLSEDVPGQYDPIRYQRANPSGSENTGGNIPGIENTSGANVTFSDEAIGFDLELIYQPLDNLQFLFNFSHTEREAQGAFQMVDYREVNTGVIYEGTEYSMPVRALGRDAFGITSEDTNGDGYDDAFYKADGSLITVDNPVLLSEAVSGIDGVSLFFNPENNATLWSRYDFVEGAMKNFGIGAGVKWSSSAPTTIAIGGENLAQNLYPTPDTEERWDFEMGLYYKFTTGNANWRLSLNAKNLTDNRGDETIVNYVDSFTGRAFSKRTESFYTPRSYRFSASVDF